MIEMRLNCLPCGKMRPRFTRVGFAYKHPRQKLRDQELTTLMLAHKPPKLLQGPLLLGVTVFKPIPKSFSKAKRTQAIAGTLRPDKKPDLDNVLKHVKDCMTGMFWEDDKQVVEYLPGTGAWYSEQPGYLILLRPALHDRCEIQCFT